MWFAEVMPIVRRLNLPTKQVTWPSYDATSAYLLPHKNYHATHNNAVQITNHNILQYSKRNGALHTTMKLRLISIIAVAVFLPYQKCSHLIIIKSPRSGVTLCFQFVSAASVAASIASAAATTFAGAKNILAWGNNPMTFIDLYRRSPLWHRLAKNRLSVR